MKQFKSLCITQGKYDQMIDRFGGIDIFVDKLSKHDVVVLSHVGAVNDSVLPNACGCVDQKLDAVPLIISKLKKINPDIEIFGYVSGTADAPSGCGYGDGHEYADNGWQPEDGININFIEWVKLWNNSGITGIMIDLVAPQYMSETTRNNIYSYCRLKGYKIMPNSTYPAMANCEFAATGLGYGDYCLVEAFCYGAGSSTLTGTNNAISKINSMRHAGFKMAAVCTREWSQNVGDTVNPNTWRNLNAMSLMNNFAESGDCYQYDRADLGIISKEIPGPAIV